MWVREVLSHGVLQKDQKWAAETRALNQEWVDSNVFILPVGKSTTSRVLRDRGDY